MSGPSQAEGLREATDGPTRVRPSALNRARCRRHMAQAIFDYKSLSVRHYALSTRKGTAMDERLARIIRNISTFEDLAQFERNADQRKALDADLREAIKSRSAELGRTLITQRTGIELNELSPAEEKIVQAVSEYVGVMKHEGKDATRTFIQLKNRGLIDAAETAVAKLKPTQGYQTLADADLENLSYEQIIVDHPEEFSARALWYARRTLGLPNETENPPARAITPVKLRTERFLEWLQARAVESGGRLAPHSNAEAAAVLGLGDMHQFGRVFGNIQSRIDFACYLERLPPLGLAANEPFAMAWDQQHRTWAFPIEEMQNASRTHRWTQRDFKAVLRYSQGLPGQAHLSWKKELSTNEAQVRAWAFGLQTESAVPIPWQDTDTDMNTAGRRNPAWLRDELILALDLYLRFRDAPSGKDSEEVAELSEFLGRMARGLAVTDAETFRNANGVYMKMMNSGASIRSTRRMARSASPEATRKKKRSGTNSPTIPRRSLLRSLASALALMA